MVCRVFSTIRSAVVAAAGLMLAPAALAAFEPASVTVLVDGLRAQDGAVEISLYDSADGWRTGAAAQSVRLDAAETPIQAAFEDLPAGDYAVRVFHDADGDGQLSTGRFGIPSERYGFSSGVRPRFRGARFEEAAFSLESGEAREESITLQGAMD